MVKTWYRSKTIWLGILMVVAAVAEYIAGLPSEASITQAISGILAIILRVVTSQSIGTPPAASTS